MTKFIELTQCLDDEKIYINPKYIAIMIPHNNIKTTTIKVVGCNYYYDVNESIKEIKDKIKKKKNKVEEVKEETEELVDSLPKYPFDLSKINNPFSYPMTSLYAAPGLFDSHTNTPRNVEDISSTTIIMSKEESNDNKDN